MGPGQVGHITTGVQFKITNPSDTAVRAANAQLPGPTTLRAEQLSVNEQGWGHALHAILEFRGSEGFRAPEPGRGTETGFLCNVRHMGLAAHAGSEPDGPWMRLLDIVVRHLIGHRIGMICWPSGHRASTHMSRVLCAEYGCASFCGMAVTV